MIRRDGNRRVSANEPGSPVCGAVELHTHAGANVHVFRGQFAGSEVLRPPENPLSVRRGATFSPDTIWAETTVPAIMEELLQ